MKKIMSNHQMYEFVCEILRAESYENPRVFSKGVRVTLIALGYDEEFVNDVFRDYLDDILYDVSVNVSMYE